MVPALAQVGGAIPNGMTAGTFALPVKNLVVEVDSYVHIRTE